MINNLLQQTDKFGGNVQVTPNRKREFILIWALFCSMMLGAQEVSICKFRGDKKAAVSLTYDDGLLEHLTLVAPEMEKRGFRGSFWIIGSVIGQDTEHGKRLTWEQVKEMEERGHEMGSHTWSHPNCKKVGSDAFMQDVYRNDSAFEANLGHKPLTLAYPYNVKTDAIIKAFAEERIGSRTFQTAHGQQNNKQTIEKMSEWMYELIKNNDWGVTMTHGIKIGYDKWYHPEELWQFYDTLKAHEDEVWVDTFGAVKSYERERESTTLDVKQDGKKTTVIPTCSLDPEIFKQPLTIKIKTDKKLKAKQGKTKLNVSYKEGYALFDIKINNGALTIR